MMSAPTEEHRGSGPAARTVEALLEVKDLHVRFSHAGRRVYAVNGVSYSVEAGRTLAIIGESGSGKTVASRALMGLLPPWAAVTGSARLQGVELIGLREREMRRHRGTGLAIVFQDPARSLNPTMRIGRQISEPLRFRLGLDRKAARQRGMELLEMVRLPAAGRRFFEYPHQLSGGMRQRVMIAIALACNPKVLIADEATTALDVTTQAQILELLVDLQQRVGMALIFISHDLALAASYADDVAVMYAGRVVERAPARQLFADVGMPYTRSLLNSIPRIEHPAHRRLPVAGGHPPNMSELPAGCAFAPRCPVASDVCRARVPVLEEHRKGHHWACWNSGGTS